MANWFKTLIDDLGDLSKPQFFEKYILPLFALFFTWGLVGNLILINLESNSLVKNKGQVRSIQVKLEQGRNRSDKYYPLIINLKNYNDEFRLSDTYRNNFTALQQKITIRDTVILYTRNKWQSILSWGKQEDIYQIEKDGQILFELSKVITEKKSQATIMTFFCLILWPWYFIYRQRQSKIRQFLKKIGTHIKAQLTD